MPRNPGGEHFAGYTIIRLIGRGGMGEIYLARHPHLPRNEALKVLPAELSRDPMYRQRFVKEAEHASSVVHPSIVTIFNSGEYDGHLWIAMEFIDGIDALKLLRKTPQGLDPQTVIAIVRSVGAALDRAHATGLLHRDVKPANILLSRPVSPDGDTPAPVDAYLSDFGIAQFLDDTRPLARNGRVQGSIGYASPELLQAQRLSPASDNYSFACSLVEMFTGEPPYPRHTSFAITYAHINDEPPRLTRRRPWLPSAMNSIFAKRSPSRRRTAIRRVPNWSTYWSASCATCPCPNRPAHEGGGGVRVTCDEIRHVTRRRACRPGPRCRGRSVARPRLPPMATRSRRGLRRVRRSRRWAGRSGNWTRT